MGLDRLESHAMIEQTFYLNGAVSHGGYTVAKKRRRYDRSLVLVPYSVYRDEQACRAWIRYLRTELKRAYVALRLIARERSAIR